MAHKELVSEPLRVTGFLSLQLQLARQRDGRAPRARGGGGGGGGGARGGGGERYREPREPSMPFVVRRLGKAQLLPAIVFIFSRNGCDRAAEQVGRALAFD